MTRKKKKQKKRIFSANRYKIKLIHEKGLLSALEFSRNYFKKYVLPAIFNGVVGNNFGLFVCRRFAGKETHANGFESRTRINIPYYVAAIAKVSFESIGKRLVKFICRKSRSLFRLELGRGCFGPETRFPRINFNYLFIYIFKY